MTREKVEPEFTGSQTTVEKMILNPDGLAKAVGYSHAIAVTGGTTVYLAGQTAMDAEGKLVAPGDIVAQFEHVISNLEIAVKASGGTLTDIVKLNMFVTDIPAYKANLRAIGEVYRAYFGKHFPAMTLVGVTELFDPAAMIEIEGVASIAS